MQLAQFIDKLDLNSYEKETILFLASISTADANTIYKKTKIPKGRIYSILNRLAEKGFIKIIPTSPKKYTIENIKESLKNYLDSEKEKLAEQINAVDKISVKPKLFNLEKNAPSVYTFTGREEHLNALISLRNRSNKTLIQVAPIFAGTFSSNRAIYKALNRGIMVRIITKKITAENKKNIKECIQLGAEVRTLNSSNLLYFLIKDTDEFILGLEDYRNKEERLSLISKNNGLLFVLEEYFENLWKTSKKIDLCNLS